MGGDDAIIFGLDAQALLSNFLLFLLIGGMAGSCDARELQRKFVSERRGILAGVFLQYVVLPFLGFLSLKVLPQDPVVMVTLLVVTTSPGGGFSGWWCSLSNADLALSIAMTSASTLACILFLPLNLALYTALLTPGMHVQIAWEQLFLSVVVVMVAVLCGAAASHSFSRLQRDFEGGDGVASASALPLGLSAQAMRQGMNTLGSAAGIGLMVFGGASNATSSDPLWENDADWFACVAAPCLLGLTSAVAIAFRLDLAHPSCVAVAIECVYQNTGLALTIALSAVPADKVGMASGVPIFYGIVEIICVPTFALIAWRLGWTYAPPTDNIVKVLALSYQPSFDEQGDRAEGGGGSRTMH